MSEPKSVRRPDSSPLAYFGYWCGEGWSANQQSDKPLTPQQIKVLAIRLKGAAGGYRYSPIDYACRIHDASYDRIAKLRDPVLTAKATMAADRELFNTVSYLLRQQAAGRNDLNMGEVLYGKDVQIAFGGKLIVDGLNVADAVRVQAMERATNSTRAYLRATLPYAVVIALGPAGIGPFIAKLADPAHR